MGPFNFKTKPKETTKNKAENIKPTNHFFKNRPSISIKTVSSDQKKANLLKIKTKNKNKLQNQSTPKETTQVSNRKKVKFRQKNTILKYLVVKDKEELA